MSRHVASLGSAVYGACNQNGGPCERYGGHGTEGHRLLDLAGCLGRPMEQPRGSNLGEEHMARITDYMMPWYCCLFQATPFMVSIALSTGEEDSSNRRQE